MNTLIIKTDSNTVESLHKFNENMKTKQYEALMVYFAICEAMEKEDFYTIDKIVIDHLLQANYVFDIKLIDNSCYFVDGYLIELTVELERCNMGRDSYRTVCYINKDLYRELKNNKLVIGG